MPKPTTIFYIVAIGMASGVIVVYLFWWAKSRYKLLTAEERPLRARQVSLWHDPGDVGRLDFRGGYGGRGLSFGAQASASEWDDALEHALAEDYVVQEALELRPEVFPVFGETAWGFQPMYVDTNPFLFRGRVEGAMVRLSGSPVVNVTSGGGETGLFVIEGEV